MIVKYDEDNFSIKLYRDFVKGKLVGLMEVIPIEDLLDVWEKHKAEQTEPCNECVFIKGSRWCDNCNGNPKGLDALPNSRKAEQTEPQKSCSTCGYSPQTPSCDTCEGYSNWWSLEDELQTDCTENCHKCKRIRECRYPIVGKCEYEPQMKRSE